MKRAVLVHMVVLCVLSSLCELGRGETNALVVPEDDLPSAIVGDHKISFTRNGALVVSKEGRWLFDGGLNYATPDWAEWGTQIRRSERGDTWERGQGNPDELVTRGRLCDVNRIQRFKFLQRSTLIAGGLRIVYEVTPLAPKKLGEFGVVFHFPIADTGDARIMMWPGFDSATLPAQHSRGVVYQGRGRGAVLWVAGRQRVTVVGPPRMRWRLLDDRAWNLNTFRLVGTDEAALRQLSEGKSASFSFDLLLGESGAGRLALGPAWCELDRYGRMAVYAEGRKLLEGGLAIRGTTPEWLLESAQPSPAAPAQEKGTEDEASGVCPVAGTAVAYQISALTQGQSVLATFHCRPANGKQLPEHLGLTLAVPESQLAPAQDGQLSVEVPEATAAVSGDGGKPMRVARVAYRGGLILELATNGSWSQSSGTLNNRQCCLLSILNAPGAAPGEGVLLRLRMLPGETRTEKRP